MNTQEIIQKAKELGASDKVLATLQEFAEKNRYAIEELSKKTEKERQEEEIQKAFEEFRVSGTPYSSFTIFEAGYRAGMKRGDK